MHQSQKVYSNYSVRLYLAPSATAPLAVIGRIRSTLNPAVALHRHMGLNTAVSRKIIELIAAVKLIPSATLTDISIGLFPVPVFVFHPIQSRRKFQLSSVSVILTTFTTSSSSHTQEPTAKQCTSHFPPSSSSSNLYSSPSPPFPPTPPQTR